MFSHNDEQFFHENGYFIARNFLDNDALSLIQRAAQTLIQNPEQPFELEAVLQYEGAPSSIDAEGGQTIRRFLQMHQRQSCFIDWLNDNNLLHWLKAILSAQSISLVTAHHNSLMTKQPKYSSATNWHRDVRYWHYDNENLVSAWLALGREYNENGGLKIIPGSHLQHFTDECYDDKKFFRDDLANNQAIIDQSINVDINAGDVLFFHARLLHAANANRVGDAKFSLVYSFRDNENKPSVGSRSDKNDVKIL